MPEKIYTKAGDAGDTYILSGYKVSKGSPAVEALGSLDELNAHLGLCADLLQEKNIENIITVTQDKIFTISAILLAAGNSLALPPLHKEDILLLETAIDGMDKLLPRLKNFILPGGHITISQLHITRGVCRRAERACVVYASGTNIHPYLLPYLNRLSDYLFVLARYAGQCLGVTEKKWPAH